MIKDGKFSRAGVEFPVDLSQEYDGKSGLWATLREFDSLSKTQKKILIAAYGIKMGRGTSSFDAIQTLKGEIQNEWFRAAKGEIPMAVAKNQEGRAKATAKDKGGENGGEKKQRVLKTVKVAVGKAEEVKALKGQAAMVIQAIKDLGGKGDANAVGAQLLKVEGFKTKQDPARVASYYFTQLGKDGILVEA